MRPLFSLVVLLLVNSSLIAQSNFQPGRAVVNGDTLRGYINQKDWTRNPSSFEFQKEKDSGAPRRFGLKDVSYFQIDGSISYQRFVTLISKDEVGLNNNTLPTVAATVDTVFMEVLRRGKVQSLFRFKDQIKTRYFILDETGNAKELVYQLYTTKGGQYVNNEAFKPQLTFAAAKSPFAADRIAWLIKSATYAEGPIVKIIDEINGDKFQENKIAAKKGVISFSAGICLIANGVSHKTLNSYTSLGTKASSTPSLSFGIDYQVNPEVSKILWRLELAVSSSDFDTKAQQNLSYPQDIDNSYKQLNTSVTPQFIYAIYNGAKVKFFGGLGFRATYTSYSNNLYTISTFYPNSPTTTTQIPDFFSLRHLWFSFQLKTGVVIHRRSEIAIGYLPSIQPINQNDGLWSETLSFLTLGFNYRFVKSSAH